MGNDTLHAPKKAQRFASAAPSADLYGEQALYKFLEQLSFIPDPDQVLVKAGLARFELRKLETDDEITAASDTRREAAISTPWHLEVDGNPAVGDPSDFIIEQITPWMETMGRASWAAVPYGYSVWETVYAKQGPSIVIDHLSEKPFEWFYPGHRGTLKFRSLDNPAPIEVDTTYKFFLTVREPTYRNPYGRALYARLYWPWFFRKQGWQFWMKYLERWGVPFLVGHTAGDVNAMSKALAKMVQNASAAVGMDDKVEALSTTGTAHFEAFERAVTARIQKVILGQTLTSDSGGSSGGSGSFALGKIHNEVREDRRNADLRLMTNTIQRQVDALWRLNKFPEPPACIHFEDDTGLQLDRAERDARLAQSGAVRFTEKYLLRAYDFEPGEVEIVPAGQPGTGTSGGPEGDAADVGTGGGTSGKFARGGQRFTQDQQAVEDLVMNAAKDLTQPVDPEAIKNAIRAARDPDDLIDRLAVLFAGIDHVAFAKIVERALFAGHIMGWVHAQNPEIPKKDA